MAGMAWDRFAERRDRLGLQEASGAGRVFGPPIRRIFRDVVVDRLPDLRPPQSAMLFSPSADPSWHDKGFLRDFYSEILHQDTCQADTADGVALLSALATDDRVPPQHRFETVSLLFSIATVADRHLVL
ncbi:hypothetical protein [Streptomyces sp. NPDC050804]|uniref:hypothetical protein n=1 Tax=Streptomyces sp. NPDC050804 TaxID=3154745 RepID=UPI003445E13B